MNLSSTRGVLAALAVCLLMLTAANEAQAKVPVSENARTLFSQGLTLAGKGNCKEGYLKFKAAYADSPSPNILGNLGYCAMQLERDGEAIAAYERYLLEGEGVSNKERAAIVQDLVKLKGRVATLRLIVSPHQSVVIDERLGGPKAVVNAYIAQDGRLNVGVHPGTHRLTIRSPGHRDFVWEVEATKGTIRERSITLELDAAGVVQPPAVPLPPTGAVPNPTPEAPLPPPETSTGIGGAVVAGFVITGALAAATVVLGVVALDNKSTFDDALTSGDVSEARDLKETGEVLNIVTDVALGVTVAAAAVTVLLWANDGPDEPEAEAAVVVLPFPVKGGGAVGVFGRF